MRFVRVVCLGFAVVVVLAACAAAGVPVTSNPDTKVQEAIVLVDQQGRPFPAEKLIVEAIQEYKTAGDESGLADAYRAYGLFFRSRTLANASYAAHYREKGFLDKDASYDTRYDRSLYYFTMARKLYGAAGKDDLLSNVEFHIGDVNVLKGDTAAACSAYEDALNTQALFRRKNPMASVDTGTHESFDAAVHASMLHAGCK
jgi:hypothetical protein